MTDIQYLLLMVLIVGFVGGFLVGRWASETGRGRFDARRAWSSRTTYRRSSRRGKRPTRHGGRSQ